MKLALITDVHANREAFEAVLDHAVQDGCERVMLLGDFVGYGADPAWVVQRVRELVAGGAIAIKGNHDEAAVRGPAESMVPEARDAVAWTRSQLDPEQLAFLDQLPLRHEEQGMLFVHANAHAPSRWEYLLSNTDALRSLRATQCGYTFCGHVHEPCLYFQARGEHCSAFVPSPGVPVPVGEHRRWVILPGSAGQPRDGNPAACYASFDLTHRILRFERVPYDHELAATKILAAGLPEMLAHRLSHGR